MYIGVDIGGTKILVVGGTGELKFDRSEKVETPDTAAQGVIEIIHLIEKVAAGEAIKSIALASTGPLDFKAGGINSSSSNMHGWRGADIVTPIKNYFRVNVALESDTGAAGIVEATHGSGQGYPYVLYVTISTGVGTALVVNGQIYHGANATEAGHMIIDPHGPQCGCGGYGHIEAIMSGHAIKKKYGRKGSEITEPEIWDEISATFAIGFHNLIQAYSPSVVVIGGGMGANFDRYHDFLVKHLQKLSPSYPLPPIVAAKYRETGAAHGALLLAARAEKSALNGYKPLVLDGAKTPAYSGQK